MALVLQWFDGGFPLLKLALACIEPHVQVPVSVELIAPEHRIYRAERALLSSSFSEAERPDERPDRGYERSQIDVK